MSLLALDSETLPFGPGNRTPPVVCVQVANATGVHIHLAKEGLDYVESVLERDTLILHNGAYDFGCFAAARPHLLPQIFRAFEEGRVKDTEVREKLLNIADGTLAYEEDDDGDIQPVRYALADLLPRYGGPTLDKSADSWRLRYGELASVPVGEWPWEARKYAWLDAAGAGMVFKGQSKRFKNQDITNELEQTQAAWCLHLMSCHGMITDAKAVMRLKETLQAKVGVLQGYLMKAGILRRPRPLKSGPRKGQLTEISANKKVAQAWVKRVYGRRGVEVPMTTFKPTKKQPKPKPTWKPQISIARETLEAPGVIDMAGKILSWYAEYGAIDKILGTYMPWLEAGTRAPIHTQFDVLKATGRTSSYKPNLQNLPRGGEVRACYVPRPGYAYAICDYSAIELRTLAQVCYELYGFSHLREAFNAGRDPHLELAADMLGMSYAEAHRLYDAGDPRVKAARQAAKAANFGYPGGLGPKKFVEYARKSYKVLLTFDEASQRRQDWFKKWPEVKKYLREFANKASEEGKVVQFGTNRVRGGVKYCDAANSPFQGMAADGIKEALWLITQACYVDLLSPLYGSRPVAMIHDELILEVPLDRASEAAEELSRLMKVGMARYVTDVKLETTLALAPYWAKDACAVRDESGKLQMWYPKPKEKKAA